MSSWGIIPGSGYWVVNGHAPLPKDGVHRLDLFGTRGVAEIHDQQRRICTLTHRWGPGSESAGAAAGGQ
jgi:hypothetical protein